MNTQQNTTLNADDLDAAVRVHHDMLFDEPGWNVYAILDGASVPGLLKRLAKDAPGHVCLYRGEIEPVLAEAAPYLVQLKPEEPFTDWVLREGWLNHWGIFALSTEEMPILRNHFRRFLMVYGPDGRQMYFRYYDPRVLRTYLPTCTPEERRFIFGPVRRYLFEDETEGRMEKAEEG